MGATMKRSMILMMAVASLAPAGQADAQDRMPPIPAEKMTAAQRAAVADFIAARSADISGPFIPLLRSPELMNRARALGDYLRYKSSLPPRLSEFVILLTARRWTQQYEWNAHQALALQGGLRADIVAAVAEGRRPDRLATGARPCLSCNSSTCPSATATRASGARPGFAPATCCRSPR